MIDQEEPQRLFESPEAPSALRSLLIRAHEDVPTAGEKAQLVRSTLERGGAARPPVHGRGSLMRWAAKAARRSTRLWSIAAVVGVGVGAGALYVAGVGSHAPLRAAKLPAVQTAEQPPPQERASERHEWHQVDQQEAATEVVPPAAVEKDDRPPLPGAQSAPALALPRDAFPGRAAPRRRARRAYAMAASQANAQKIQSDRIETDRVVASRDTAATPLPTAPTPASQVSAPEQPRPTAAPVAATARPTSEVATDHVVESSGADEATLLRSARQALARSPRRTLALTNEHRLRYPHGILDQEREALAIEALIKLGRLDEARPRARDFALTYPGSPHRARLERALASPPAPDAAP